MAVYRDRRDGRWRYRATVRLADGRSTRISGSAPSSVNTKQAAEAAERTHALRATSPGLLRVIPASEREEVLRKETPVPTLDQFADQFLAIQATRNKPSEIDSKTSILRCHLRPSLGRLRLDQITYARIQDYCAAKVSPTDGRARLSPKTINNHLTVLHRMLSVAAKRGLIASVPEIEWLRAPRPAFDFLTFEEAERLVDAAEGEWRTMILLGLRTGLRQSELLALRWEDVDLVAGRLVVRQAVVRGRVGTPKSGRSREIPLGDEILAALKGHRHLRGPLVFCSLDGRMFTKGENKHPLWRACKRAGLRLIGWHCLRHTFASHLVMRGVALKAVQELMGHSTVEMTMRYAHLSPHVTREAVRTLDRPRAANRLPTAAKAGLSS